MITSFPFRSKLRNVCSVGQSARTHVLQKHVRASQSAQQQSIRRRPKQWERKRVSARLFIPPNSAYALCLIVFGSEMLSQPPPLLSILLHPSSPLPPFSNLSPHSTLPFTLSPPLIPTSGHPPLPPSLHAQLLPLPPPSPRPNTEYKLANNTVLHRDDTTKC